MSDPANPGAPKEPLWATAYIGAGANLGDARLALALAAQALAQHPDIEAVRQSSLFRSAPVDAQGPDYLNGVLEVSTRLSPEDLLERLQAIETGQGRERPYRHAPRTLDLDLLVHGGQVRHHPRLILPHPRLHLRAFVLLPLLELAPDLELPGIGRLGDRLAAVSDQRIERIAPAPW